MTKYYRNGLCYDTDKAKLLYDTGWWISGETDCLFYKKPFAKKRTEYYVSNKGKYFKIRRVLYVYDPKNEEEYIDVDILDIEDLSEIMDKLPNDLRNKIDKSFDVV